VNRNLIPSMLILSIILIAGCSVPKTCEDRAKDLLPPNLTLRDGMGWQIISGKNSFTDGSNIDASIQNVWYSGRFEGQNVNYYYLCNTGDVFPSLGVINSLKDCQKGALSYSRQVIDESGKIQGANSFIFRPVLKPINETYKDTGGGWSEQVFEAIEPNIDSCKWIK